MKVHEMQPTEEKRNAGYYTSIFLAGSIEMGKAIDWQREVIKSLESNDNTQEIVVYNPRRDNWDSSWEQNINNEEFKNQVEWELEHIEKSDIVAFYFQPGTNSPISLLELGLVAKDSFKINKIVVVLCPEGYHRKGNIDVTGLMYDMYFASDMDDFKAKINKFATELQ